MNSINEISIGDKVIVKRSGETTKVKSISVESGGYYIWLDNGDRVNSKEELTRCFNEALEDCTDKIENIKDNKEGFTTTCNHCGSNNVILCDEIDYDYEEEPYVSGHYLKCKNCGEIEDI